MGKKKGKKNKKGEERKRIGAEWNEGKFGSQKNARTKSSR
jgi:hypothetical protein